MVDDSELAQLYAGLASQAGPGFVACCPAVAEFSEGVYETVRTIGLDNALAGLPPDTAQISSRVDPADAPDVVATHVAEAVRRAIASETDVGRRVELTNDLLAILAVPEKQLPGVVEHLVALTRQLAPGSPRRSTSGNSALAGCAAHQLPG